MGDERIEQPRLNLYTLQDSLGMVNATLGRLDERLHGVSYSVGQVQTEQGRTSEKVNEISQRICLIESEQAEFKKIGDKLERLSGTLAVLGDRLRAVEGDDERGQDRWKTILDFAIKIAGVVVASWILWKLHLQPVP
jgi:predicted nuclease with TOPRIM domain